MNKIEYRKFCNLEAKLPIFFQDWYLDITCGSENWAYAYVLEGEVVAGIWPYFLKRTWGLKRITMPPFLRYLGPWVSTHITDPEHQMEILKKLQTQIPQVWSFSQDMNAECTELLPKTWRGMHISKRYTYVLEDVHRQDELFFNLNPNYRKSKIPKAAEHYDVVQNISFEQFITLHNTTYLRKGMPLPASSSYFETLDAALAQRGARLIIGAKHKDSGEVHAVAYLIADNQTCYLLAAAQNHEHKSGASGIFIIWHAILMAHNHFGLQRFDFLGSMIKSIEMVRKQFGAEKHYYLRLESKHWLVKRLLKFSKIGKAR